MQESILNVMFLAGIVILSGTLILRTWFRYRQEAKRAIERRAAARAAREAERKRQAMLAEPPKIKLASGSHTAPDRVPLGSPHDPAFAAGVTPRSIAKWETEIHQIGRQMIGQLDSKSIVLQTLTREANRAANRLEILIDHLETLLKDSIASTKSTTAASDSSEHSNLIPREAATQAVEVFADVLDELEGERDQFPEPVAEPAPSLIVLRAETPADLPSSPPTVSSVPQPNVTTLSQKTHRITVQPAEAEFSAVPAPAPSAVPRQPGLSLASLFDDSLVKQHDEPESMLGRPSIPVYQTPLIEQPVQPKQGSEPSSANRFVSEAAAPFDKRRQVEMLADYGYTPKQIAQDLDLTVGEVELMISLRN